MALTDAGRPTELRWKCDWAAARRHHEAWWRQQGLVLSVTAPRRVVWCDVPPPPPADLETRWYDPRWRVQAAEHHLSRTWHGGDAFPLVGTHSAAGDLASYLGCETRLSPDTVWCEPLAGEPEDWPPLAIDADSAPWRAHLAMARCAVSESRGRWLVSMPDLVENLDIVSALRGPQRVVMDLVDRPEWVLDRIWQVNEQFKMAFDAFFAIISDGYGGNAFVFDLWGPGKTAKVQCDAAAMISPAMFRRFVVPALSAQCDWLDFSMFHLDGEDAVRHLDALLEIPGLSAIEWTPRRISVGDSGGHPRHWDLYRRILAGGKSVQAVGVRPDEALPMLDALGGDGMYIQTWAESEEAGEALVERVAAYR
jgi:hypothetical protein